jgi:hypothetical protein
MKLERVFAAVEQEKVGARFRYLSVGSTTILSRYQLKNNNMLLEVRHLTNERQGLSREKKVMLKPVHMYVTGSLID